MDNTKTYTIYGLRISSDYPFQTPLIPDPRPADVVFSCEDISRELLEILQSRNDQISITDTQHGHRRIFVYHLDDNSYVIEYRNAVLFQVKPRTITAHIQNPDCLAILEMLLLGPTLALWHFTQGKLGLHAAAVSVDNQAVIFCAHNHSGKTSLAASLIQVGGALLADDYAAINHESGCDYVYPGYPQMRMWEDQANVFVRDYANLPFMLPTYPKRMVPIGQGSFGQFNAQACPLKVIYIPERWVRDGQNEGVEIQALSKAAAVATLMRNGVVANLRRWLPLHMHNMHLLSDLITRIPVRSISYPSGYGYLPKVRDAILEDISSL